jgi:hypothetical protein
MPWNAIHGSLSRSELTAEVEPNDAETQAQTLSDRFRIVSGGSLTLRPPMLSTCSK